MNSGDFLLDKHSFIYENLFDILIQNNSMDDIESRIAKARMLSEFAWHAHPGRFNDLRLDHWVSELGRRVWNDIRKSKTCAKDTPRSSKKRVLHIATETYYVGGHTRILLNLIKNDRLSVHSLILTRQQIKNAPAWLIEEINISGGSIDSLEGLTSSERIASLQRALCSSADYVFYHIHPDDAVAIAALAAVPRAQVMFINHADHVFCLGTSLVDVVVCYRVWSLQFSLTSRNAQKVFLLPTPIKTDKPIFDNKLSAKRALNISEDKILILTVASYAKFIPSGHYNYFKTLKTILERHPQVLLKVAGVSATDDLRKIGFEHHAQVELLGVVQNPQKYYEAADIYVDSMPFSSFTSLFEAIYFKCYPVLQYYPVNTLKISSEPAINNLISHPDNESEQIKVVERAIVDSAYRTSLTERLYVLVKNNYVGDGWLSTLNSLYTSTSDETKKLSGLNIQLSSAKHQNITENDIDAASLAESLYGTSEHRLFSLLKLRKNIRYIYYKDIFKLFYKLNEEKDFGKIISVKDLIYILGKKLVINLLF